MLPPGPLTTARSGGEAGGRGSIVAKDSLAAYCPWLIGANGLGCMNLILKCVCSHASSQLTHLINTAVRVAVLK